jgi:hypothetical protein
MADAKLVGLAQLKARLSRMPLALDPALRADLKAQAEDLAAAMKRAAQVQGLPEVAESIHILPSPSRVIGVVIVADPKDAKGKNIGSNIEAGHKSRDGSPVAAIASFFPTWRARKKAIQAHLKTTGRAAIKKAWEA